jgi:HEAT repeat protein
MRLVVFGFLAVVFVTGNESLRAQAPPGIAWDILEKGHASRHAKERIIAVRALAHLPGNSRAVELAEELIVDREPDVRAAAALTLGQLNAVRSIPLLREALKDKNIHVDFAASNALLSLGDSSGYAIYYEVLIGKRKSGEGPVEEQKRLIKDPKAMTLMMLGTAAGFAPYAGYGWAMFQAISKDYAGPVRVEAMQKLAKDPDAQTEVALIEAASNKNWKLRVAALEALAQRGDPRLADTLASHLSDKNQAVRCAAAAGFIRLSGAKEPEIQQSRALP